VVEVVDDVVMVEDDVVVEDVVVVATSPEVQVAANKDNTARTSATRRMAALLSRPAGWPVAEFLASSSDAMARPAQR
jgi:hypothetical protein